MIPKPRSRRRKEADPIKNFVVNFVVNFVEPAPFLRILAPFCGHSRFLISLCIEQAAYWYQRRAQLGLVSISSGDNTVQQFQSADLLPQVQAVLSHYQRWVN